MHRAVDPADGEAYVYGMSFLDAAPSIFACFDQPDLKAPYDVTVHAPQGWTVFGNGATEQTGPQDFRLATTKPLATYFVTVCAGPWATLRDEHDGIPLSISARASQRDLLEAQAPQMFEVTKQSFDHYHRLFGVRYDFGDYDQLFVPEFNAGAMENPGCVVHSDSMIFRGGISRAQLLGRSNTIAHEMAHMWFGDMVTMTWWDDLWLNESFAEYMSHRCLAESTEFTEAFVDFGASRKAWGYRADRAPSTHPVAGAPAPDAHSALQNFDGISYAKGASVLRQLIAHIGDDAFVVGVRDHIERHLYANAGLADFMSAMERASGRDLTAWQQAWLGTAGTDVVAVHLERDGDRVTGATVTRHAPVERPADRPHTFDVAGYSGGDRVLQADLTAERDEQQVPELVGQRVPELLIPNAADLTWAEVRLDDATLAALPEQLAGLPDGSARAVAWCALDAGVMTGRVDPRLLAGTIARSWGRESDDGIRAGVAMRIVPRLRAFLPAAEVPDAYRGIAAAGRELFDRAADGSPDQLAGARLVAGASDDVQLLGRWLTGDGLPESLRDDTELRWAVARSLARVDALDDATLQRLSDADRTMQGELEGIRIRALRPTAEAKEQAWESLAHDAGLSNYQLVAHAEGLWGSGDPELLRPYVARYFADVPPLAERVTGMALGRVATAAFPWPVVEQDTLDRSREALARTDLADDVRRSIVDQSFLLECALRARTAFPGGDTP
ncbi:aminopeptidase N [Barrientosiimonas humi]|uniref:aminopeptidase N n=1 Tax=Barrientosiimonas humi TaxID=999931 RepID=UPI00370DA9A1